LKRTPRKVDDDDDDDDDDVPPKWAKVRKGVASPEVPNYILHII